MSLWVSLLVCFAVQLCLTAQPVDEVITAKEVLLLGGWSEIELNSTEVQAAVQHAVKTFNTNSKSKRLFRLVAITAAQSQVTNQINFRIQVILGKTRCLKSEDVDLSQCPADGKQLRCNFQVTFDPENNQLELKNPYMQVHKCKSLEKTA